MAIFDLQVTKYQLKMVEYNKVQVLKIQQIYKLTSLQILIILYKTLLLIMSLDSLMLRIQVTF
jgi:hypothetical protein